MSKTQNSPSLFTRGVAQILPDSASLIKRAQEKPLRLYLGIDPTGSFLHLGHSVVLRKLQQFAQAGHQVILLVGNGTVRIGDPTGRDSTRPVLTDEQIQANFKDWQAQASNILDFDKIEVRYNGDWLDKLDYAQIVKLLATTTVQQLLERDMFQNRLKNGLPIFGHEIIYPLLQGYDSVAMDVDLEIGGSDQTFNMMVGRHLQQIYHQHEKWVLTTPIINGLDGRKMSKSYNNYISLTDSASDMYFKMMTAQDEVILEYFELLTDVDSTEIDNIRAALSAGENPLTFKKRLAWEIAKMYHSSAAADQAAQAWQKTVSEKQIPSDLPVISVPDFNLSLFELAVLAQPQASRSQLRRLIDQKAVQLLDNHVLRIGKKNYYQLVLSA